MPFLPAHSEPEHAGSRSAAERASSPSRAAHPVDRRPTASLNKDRNLERDTDAMGLRAAQEGLRSGDAPGGAHAAGCGCEACHGPGSPSAPAVSPGLAAKPSGVAQLCEHGHPWHSHLPVCPDPPFSYFSVPLPAPKPAIVSDGGEPGPSVGSSGPTVSPSVSVTPTVAPSTAEAQPVKATAVSGGSGAGAKPKAPSGVKSKAWARTMERGVQLGAGHKEGSKKKGKSVTTDKTEERLTRHINAFLEGKKSKARPVGKDGQNLEWSVDRSTAERQKSKGSRSVLQHLGGGDGDDPVDYFEKGSGNMSDTDDSDVEPNSGDE